MSRGQPLLVAEGISRSFGTREVLREMTFSLDVSEWLVLRGESGSGKSTLLRIICGLECASSGNLVIAGHQALRLCGVKPPGRSRMPKIGYAPQAADLWDFLTARENVALPLRLRGFSKADAERCADELLDEVDLLFRREQFPAELSGGEQQRVAVARALAAGPHLLILDEPTANLDDVAAGLVWEAIRKASRSGIAIIVASHSALVPAEAVTLNIPKLAGDGPEGESL